MENVFVQIGLNDHLDFAYLAKPDFRSRWENLKKKKFRAHERLLDVSEPYHVIGVDMQSKKNDLIRSQHAYNPRIHILDYLIYSENVPEFAHGKTTIREEYHGYENIAFAYKNKSVAITLSELFEKIKHLPNLKNPKIRAVHMNIESAEIDVLKGIDWETFEKPEIMRIATRHGRNPEIDAYGHHFCLRVMQENGYVRVYMENDRQEYITFLRGENQ